MLTLVSACLSVCLPGWLAGPDWLLARWIMHSTTYD
jgi:hypothetical protein